MAETELERIKGLEVITNIQQKQIDEHEERLSTLEDVSVVVGKLSDTVDRTNNAVNGLVEIINDMKKTTKEIELCQTRLELKQQYYIWDGITGLCKKLPWKSIITVVAGGGVLSGIVAYLNSVLHIFG